MRSPAGSLLLIALFVAGTAAQAPKSTTRIRGRVVAADTGRPIRNATVNLGRLGTSAQPRAVRTDANGEYVIDTLPAGQYSFYVTHPRYLQRHFDQPHPLARYRLLELAEAEQLDDMDFQLHRGAVITGIITDEFGDPIPGVRVAAMRGRFGPDGKRLVEVPSQVVIPTDDEGRYRLAGLLPGTYSVFAIPAEFYESPVGYGRTYYPGTLKESDAQTVRIDLGLDGVANFSLVPSTLVRISGVVRDSQGRAAAGWSLRTYELRGSIFVPLGGDSVKDDGSFEIERMLPGQYLLHVRPPYTPRQLAPATSESAMMPLEVSGESISGLAVTTSLGFAVSGRVTFEGSSAPPLIKGLRIFALGDPSLQQLFSRPAPDMGLVDTANRFLITGVRGKVRLTHGGGEWLLKRVLLKGADVTRGLDVTGDIDGIEVVLTNQRTTVTGAVRDARGIGRNDFIIAFFPTAQYQGEDRGRRQRTIRPDPDGVYRIRNLPHGDYIAAAVPVMSLPMGDEWDPAFLARVKPRATGFTLGEGQTLTLNLTLIE